MSKSKRKIAEKKPDAVLDRVISILEEARGNVVRAVNSNMVLAYWLIGREIVQELQGGQERAEYGEKMLSELSVRLLDRYGSGFSVPNLQNFRKFYLAYSTRFVTVANIQYPVGTKSAEGGIQHPAGIKSSETSIPDPAGGESKSNLVEQEISRPMGVESSESSIPSPLGRKLSSFQKGHPGGDESLQGFSPQLSWSHYRALMRVDKIEARDFYEREAIAGAWDKRTLERQIQSFYLLIDLKVGELTHADVGQMDGYVRMFDGLYIAPDDNPTIGLILCTEKNETVARYSVLSDRKQIFASKYVLCLPTEEQLRMEVERERRLIEAAQENRDE